MGYIERTPPGVANGSPLPDDAFRTGSFVMTPAEFQDVCDLVHKVSGIRLREGKEALVMSRLTKRLRELSLPSITIYLQHVRRDTTGKELLAMIDALTTNKTFFFREPHHFEFLKQHVLPRFGATGRGPTIWSAGCSTGEEPYTIAITLAESLNQTALKSSRILATDVAPTVLAVARRAAYGPDCCETLPAGHLEKHFVCEGTASDPTYRVKPATASLVRFAQLNLMHEWPMKGPFDVIFCRNVMIYFDAPVRKQLLERYWRYLVPGGYLFVGHSEGLSGLGAQFDFVAPATYRKSQPAQ